MRGGAPLHQVTALPAPEAATIVMACGVAPLHRARMSDALRGRAVVRVVDRFSDLVLALNASVEHIDAIVLGACDVNGVDAVSAARAIAIVRPRTAIISYCQ